MNSDEEALARNSASIKALKARKHAPVDITELRNIEKDFADASDRAYAIMWASVVEDRLRRALPNGMRQDLSNTMISVIFDDGGPLETFSAKIAVGYAINLYGRKTYHDLEIIRALRNEFAHNHKSIRFDTPEVKAVCATLIIPDTKGAYHIPPSELRQSERTGVRLNQKLARSRYAVAAHSISLNLIEIYERPNPWDGRRFARLLP